MRFPHLLVISLVVCAPFLLPSEAVAIGCWVCQNQADTCMYYREAEKESCLIGCNRMYTAFTSAWNACRSACQSDYLNGIGACHDDYAWCAEGCVRESDERFMENCPIVLDLGRHGWNFTSAGGGVLFDIDGDGLRDSIAWTDPESEDGFLAWDRNLNGIIDSGRELFGDSTLQPPSDEPNGFLALAVLDQVENGGNGDGVISNQDGLWGALKIWVDRNHNGRSEDGELTSLGSHQVGAIDLAFRESRRKDPHGNELRYRSKVLLEDGAAIDVIDVFFQRLP